MTENIFLIADTRPQTFWLVSELSAAPWRRPGWKV
jgi:hypothetical protein